MAGRIVVSAVDLLDVRLLELLAAEPRLGVLEASRRLGVARGTVQSRLERLRTSGVVVSFGPTLDPAALGFGVTAFVTLEISQAHGHTPVRDHLAGIPEVLEAHTHHRTGDLLARVATRSNADLQRVLDLIVASDDVARASSVIALSTQIPMRMLPLLRAARDSDISA